MVIGWAKQICRFSPQSVILYERAESPLYDIELELKEHVKHLAIIPKLADILDKKKLQKIFEDERPHVVFHAAAYKHVPMLEIPCQAKKCLLIRSRYRKMGHTDHESDYFQASRQVP